jgi:hypothetical protein
MNVYHNMDKSYEVLVNVQTLNMGYKLWFVSLHEEQEKPPASSRMLF